MDKITGYYQAGATIAMEPAKQVEARKGLGGQIDSAMEALDHLERQLASLEEILQPILLPHTPETAKEGKPIRGGLSTIAEAIILLRERVCSAVVRVEYIRGRVDL